MRLLANENIPLVAVQSLRAHGFNVLWIREMAPGSADEDVLALASEEERVLLTFDKDFGELAFRSGLPAKCGIVLFRIPMRSAEYLAQFIVNLMASRSDWSGQFSVVEVDRIRMKPL
jgi:predicted nuclease of predicted toxin-antitoxin system